MRIIMMACTVRGFEKMRRAAASLARRLPEAEIVQEGRCAHVPGYEDGPRFSQSTERWFSRADALVYFAAAGIAVRCIAPFVRDKFTDPAVLVMDEGGNYCISLLSGHIGGANRLCRILAEETGALPVITTATDTQHRFAVDEFAVEHGLRIHSREAAKRISAAVVAGETVKIYVDVVPSGPAIPMDGPPGDAGLPAEPGLSPVGLPAEPGFSPAGLPAEPGLSPAGLPANAGSPAGSTAPASDPHKDPARAAASALPSGAVYTGERTHADILVSIRKMPGDRPDALYLIPSAVTLGIGCRKGAETEKIREAAAELLRETGVFREALGGIASIDLKKEEPGLLAFAQEWELALTFFTAGELQAVPGSFSASAFVKKTTGVDNVCERSAVRLAGEGAVLLAEKTAKNGVTAALAVRKQLLPARNLSDRKCAIGRDTVLC